MVTFGAGRSGHSLAELMVAVTFLGVALAAASSAAVLGFRWTGDAVHRQRALAVAEAVLDSLALEPAQPTPAAAVDPPWSVEWHVQAWPDEGAVGLRVRVGVGDGKGRLAEVVGAWAPAPPVVPPPVVPP